MLRQREFYLTAGRDAGNVHPTQHNTTREVSEESPKRLVELVCPWLGSLKGLKGTKDMTTAPRLVYSAIWELVQESVKGNTVPSVDIADTPIVVPEKSDLGVKMKLVASHLFVTCQAVLPTQQLNSYSEVAFS